MTDIQDETSYMQIAPAIKFICDNRKSQPRLEAIAEAVNMSPSHFQRIFEQWAGATPKQFVQCLDVDYAKRILKQTQTSLLDAAQEVELFGAGRLLVAVEEMTLSEYENGGKSLSINYSFATTPFGDVLIASTAKGVCSMGFADNHADAFLSLQKKFPQAGFKQMLDDMQQNALSVFVGDGNNLREIKLHLKGTAFQIKVWKTLLKIPMGGMVTYGDIAASINNPHAYRAVGTAVGENPVVPLIPCHRVIRASGELGNYHWGEVRKAAIIGWEAVKRDIQ